MERLRRRDPKLINLNPGAEGVVRWKYVGGNFIVWGGHHIKNGQEFLALPAEVPPAFRDVVKPVGGETAIPKDPLQSAEVVFNYSLQEREDDPDLWDIVDSRGKRVNENPMSKSEAEKLLEVL